MSEPRSRVFMANDVEVTLDGFPEDLIDRFDRFDRTVQVLIYLHPDGKMEVSLREHDNTRDRWGRPVTASEEIATGRRLVTGSDEHRAALVEPEPEPGSRQSQCFECRTGDHEAPDSTGHCMCCGEFLSTGLSE